MSNIIASVSGVRGIYGDNLTPDNINKFTSAFGVYCKSHKKKLIVVGRDGRLHGEKISNIVIVNLLLSGYNVVDIGVAPTPTVQLAVEELNAAGGIAVTASHNPQIWNGLKFLNNDGTFLSGKQVTKFLNIAAKGNFIFTGVNNIGMYSEDDTFIEIHIKKLLSLPVINTKAIKSRKFNIVVDAVNASGSFIVPELLRRLGCNVIELYCDGSGIFPHTPEPLPENLQKLCSAVKKYDADLGISIDPDADRLVIITDKGEPFIEENSITTAVNYVLKKSKSNNCAVVVNLSTTRAVNDVAEIYGAKVFRSPVGEINVVDEMKKRQAVVGGEGSGGVILPELHYGRDSLAGIGLLLSEFAEFDGTVSDYKKSLPQYYILKTKLEDVKNPDKILEKVLTIYKTKNCRITKTDGVKLDFPDYWIHLRKSNTEPIIRIIVEAADKNTAAKIVKDFRKSLNL